MVYTIALVRGSADAGVRAAADASWRHWVRTAAGAARGCRMRRQDLSVLEVVRRYPLPLRVLRSSGRAGVEEVIDTLESTPTLPRYLGVLAQRILQLNI